MNYVCVIEELQRGFWRCDILSADETEIIIRSIAKDHDTAVAITMAAFDDYRDMLAARC